VAHSLELTFTYESLLTVALAHVSWKYVKSHAKRRLMEATDEDDEIRIQHRKNLQAVEDHHRFFKAHYIDHHENKQTLKKIAASIITYCAEFPAKNAGIKNLQRQFPDYTSEQALSLF